MTLPCPIAHAAPRDLRRAVADFSKAGGPQARIERQRWYSVSLDLDCDKQSFTLRVDGRVLRAEVPFTEKLEAAERIVFRTGVWRGFVMSHLIHHRAQLGVYLRMNDVPLPSVYGPSADEGSL